MSLYDTYVRMGTPKPIQKVSNDPKPLDAILELQGHWGTTRVSTRESVRFVAKGILGTILVGVAAIQGEIPVDAAAPETGLQTTQSNSAEGGP